MALSRTITKVIACSVLFGASASHASNYVLKDLGVLSGYVSMTGTAINELGQVAGIATGANGLNQAFLYDSVNGLVGLGTLGGSSSQAWGINDAGQVTGFAQVASGLPHAFIYGSSGMTDLTPGASTFSMGFGINNSGLVVGTSGDKAYSFDASGAATPLGLSMGGGMPTPLSVTGYAYAVNNNGVSTGYVNFSYKSGAYPYDMAFTSVTGANGSNLVPGISLSTSSSGRAINDNGVIVGSASFNGLSKAFVTRGGDLVNLGAFCGGGNAGASGINNLGQIVGSSQICDGSGNRHGFIVGSGDEMIDLNSLLAPQDASNWVITSASAINEVGQITGQGLVNGQLHAYILTPVPEASTNAMMLLGLLTLGAVTRARRKLK